MIYRDFSEHIMILGALIRSLFSVQTPMDVCVSYSMAMVEDRLIGQWVHGVAAKDQDFKIPLKKICISS